MPSNSAIQKDIGHRTYAVYYYRVKKNVHRMKEGKCSKLSGRDLKEEETDINNEHQLHTIPGVSNKRSVCYLFLKSWGVIDTEGILPQCRRELHLQHPVGTLTEDFLFQPP